MSHFLPCQHMAALAIVKNASHSQFTEFGLMTMFESYVWNIASRLRRETSGEKALGYHCSICRENIKPDIKACQTIKELKAEIGNL